VWVELTDLPIDPARAREFVGGDPRFGGIVTFDGVTRAEHDDAHGALSYLEYEAYDDMASVQIRRLVARAMESWPVGRVVVLHRTGVVKPGEVAVIISVACEHRAQAFEACRFLIDTLKAEVPIWKKDVFEDGFTRWVDPTQHGKSRTT